MAVLVAEQGIAGPAECAAGGADQPAGQRMLRLDVSLNRVYNSANVWKNARVTNSVRDPDPHVFGLPGSGSSSQRCGSGSGSSPFSHKCNERTEIMTAK
jgi:hypothetical protein